MRGNLLWLLVFLVSVVALGITLAIPTHYVLNMGDRLTRLEVKVKVLESQIETNKKLVKATQRMVVPDDTALKEDIDG